MKAPQWVNWHEVKGDDTLALDWPIGPESVVWEIGGYEGRWAAQMAEKYNPNIEIYEPQGWAFKKLEERFGDNPKVSLWNFGLWTYTTQLVLREYETDGASLTRLNGRNQAVCDFEDIYGFMQAEVDVCLMNIEGGEYVLLPYLIGLDLMKTFRFFWCQFHYDLAPYGAEKTRRIFRGLERTHRILWDAYPTAVAWERR